MAQMLFADFGYIVDSCPRNKTEYVNSATRLSCGVDENGRSQYVCLPNHEKSDLVEFCYGSTIGLYEKGNCIEVYESGNLDQTSCLHFTDGCPLDHFFLSDLYKFPACQGINPQERCFYADPVCPNSTDIPDTGISPENGILSTGAVAGITLGILGVVVAIVVVILILLKRRHESSKGLKKPLDEMELKTTLILSDSQSNKRKQENKYNTLDADVHELEKNDEEEQGSMSEDSQPEVDKCLDAKKSTNDAESQILVPKNNQGTGQDLTQTLFHVHELVENDKAQDSMLVDSQPEVDKCLDAWKSGDDVESQNVVLKNNPEKTMDFMQLRCLCHSLFDLGDYSVWKTGISDQFSTLTDDEVSVLYCFLCSDSGPPDFTDTEWLDMLNVIREYVYDKKSPVTNEIVQQTLDRLKSCDFIWKDQDKIHITDDTKDETMYQIALECNRIAYPVPFYISSYGTATRYLRSSRYTRKNGEKCVIGHKMFSTRDEFVCDLLLTRFFQMNILTHVTMEDTFIFKMLVRLLNTPNNKINEKQRELEQFIENLKETGEAVHYRGRSRDSIHHVTWLWRFKYVYDVRPDIVRSCIGLHPHWDIYIIDNKAYRKLSRYHKYPEEDRSLLYCLLSCDNYTGNVKEESFKSILKTIREKYFPKPAPSADFTRLQHDVKETQNGVVTFASEGIKQDVMYAFVTECLVEDSDLEFFLTTASRDVISEYCRSWWYKRSEGERCLYVPRTMYDLFINKLQLDIISHRTVSDILIHDSISTRLKIPIEILSWDQESRERYLEYAKRGTQTVHHGRGMIVGCAGAGKTTLLKRLMGCNEEELRNVKSTEGLEVHEEVFEICENTRSLKVKKINRDAVQDRGSQKTVSFFDFGGQCAYYACHQIYLTRRAFYIVVVDASKDLDQLVEREVCDQIDTVFAKWKYKDYFLFWVKSIHTYCYGNSHEGRDSDVIIILVATHWDKSVYKDKAAFLDGLQSVLPANSNLVQYIREDRCFCTEFPLSPINDLEEFIVQIAAEEKWSEQIPHEWVFFDEKIQKEKDERVLNFKDITRVLQHYGDEGQVLDLAKDMLRYHHDSGKILHFDEEYLNKSVIIDVQWFVNAFKLIITDRHHVKGIVARRQDWEEYYKTGNLPDSLLRDIWKLEDEKVSKTMKTNSSLKNKNTDKDPRFLLNHKEELLLYMQRLGLMSSEGQTHYVPSMNKKDFGDTQKKLITGLKSKSSVLVFLFDFLPYFFFYRLVVRLMQIKSWEVIIDDGISCLYKDAALFSHQSHNIAVVVTPSTIQLQLFQFSPNAKMLPEVTMSIRKTVEEILQNMTKTFHKDLTYKVGYICDLGENSILGEDVAYSFVKEDELEAGSIMTCPRHKIEKYHEINPQYMCAYWK